MISFSALLVLSIIFAVQPIRLAHANGIPAPPINRIFIESDGTVEPSTAPIMRNGNVYILTGEMPNSSIVVNRDNIVIDGAGHGIHGYGTSNYDGIIISYRTNVTIKNLDISPFGHGVRMDYASNNTITGNKMRAFTGVSLLYSDFNKIIGNTITDGYGVQGLGSNNLIIGNNFTSGLSGGGNGKGVSISGNYNTISQNVVRHEVSIDIYAAQYNIISHNTVLDGESGILIVGSSNNLVFGNIIKGKMNSRSGALYISHESFSNIIFANRFENNALAVSLGAKVASRVWNNLYNNTFYHNNFVHNAQKVWIAPGTPVNFWDNGREGNYWSGFHGVDSNRDGLSETPYEINENNTDRHPLMEPIDISTATPPSTLPYSSPSPTTSESESPTSSPSSATPTEDQTLSPSPVPTATPEERSPQKPTSTPSQKTPAPSSTILIVTSAVTLFSVVAGVLVYFTKHKR
jgi:parallel beta-helix repeat protein